MPSKTFRGLWRPPGPSKSFLDLQGPLGARVLIIERRSICSSDS